MGLHGDPQHTLFHMSHYITQQVAGIATFDYTGAPSDVLSAGNRLWRLRKP